MAGRTSEGSSKRPLDAIARGLTIGAFFFVFSITILESNIVYWSIGSYSISAYLSLVTPFFLLTLLSILVVVRDRAARQPRLEPFWADVVPRELLLAMAPWTFLLLIGVISLTVRWRLEGLQNVLVLSVFVFGIIAFSLSDHKLTHLAANSILPIIGSVTGLLFILLQIIDTESRFGIELFSPRQFAMVAIVTLATALSSKSTSWLQQVPAFIIFVAVVMSASRTATVVAVALYLVSLMTSSPTVFAFLRRAMLFLIAAIGTIAIGIATTRDLAERFEAGGEEQTTILSDSGRFSAWAQFLDLPESILDWVFGLGSGASAEFGQRELEHFPQTLNEYLRFVLDNGIFGLALFLIGIVSLILLLRPNFRARSPENAAVMTISGLALISLTDGPFYSFFVVLPAALVIGSGIQSALRNRSL